MPSPGTLAIAQAYLRKFDFDQSHMTLKLSEFTSCTGLDIIYVLSGNNNLGVIFEPRREKLIREFADRNLLRVKKDFYHNSNMRKFPPRVNGGRKATRYGVKIEFPEPNKLEDCLSFVFSR